MGSSKLFFLSDEHENRDNKSLVNQIPGNARFENGTRPDLPTIIEKEVTTRK